MEREFKIQVKMISASKHYSNIMRPFGENICKGKVVFKSVKKDGNRY